MTSSQRWLVFIGLLVSLIFLALAFNGLNPAAVWEHIRTANIFWLLAGIASFFVSLVLIALRWQFLLRGIQFVPLRYLTEIVAMCYMGNNVYPLRAGEFLRIGLIQRDYKIPVAKTTTTIFIERVFDGIVMLAFITIPLLFITVESPVLRTAINVTSPLFITTMIFFFILAARPDLFRKLVKAISGLLPAKLQALVIRVGEDIIGGLAGLQSARHLVGTIVSSFGTWLFNALVYWLVALAFDIEVSYAVMLIITGVVNLAGAFPVSPGQIGVFEFLVSTILIAIGINEDRAIAYALVVHVVIWLPVTLYGFALLAQRGLGIRAITQARNLESAPPTP